MLLQSRLDENSRTPLVRKIIVKIVSRHAADDGEWNGRNHYPFIIKECLLEEVLQYATCKRCIKFSCIQLYNIAVSIFFGFSFGENGLA